MRHPCARPVADDPVHDVPFFERLEHWLTLAGALAVAYFAVQFTLCVLYGRLEP